ncbi:MAG TPA: hypothetical protein ENF73_01725 [Proteobacteria bacterium]|nr:hypothetical protein [Pseudomonadota bacterium]
MRPRLGPSTLAALLAATLLLFAPPDARAGTQLLAGMAKVDMTLDPTAGTIRLGGYSGRGKKPASGVLDHVFARSLVVSDGKDHTFALVSADLCYINSELREAVLKRLKSHGFDGDNLLLAATHTHSSFAGYDRTFLGRKLFGEFDPAILDHLASSIARAVVKARSSMRPAVLEMATGRLEGMNRNRRDPVFDIETGRADSSRQPDRERYPTDEHMTVVRVAGEDGTVIGAVIHFTAHPTVLSPKNLAVSADFPGVLCRLVEDGLGGDAVAMFLNGTLGDVAPLPDWADEVETEVLRMKDYGRQLGNAAIDLLAGTHPMSTRRIAYNAVDSGLPQLIVRPLLRFRVPRAMYRLLYYGDSVPFQAVRLGDLVLFAIPGEPTTQFGWALKELCPAGRSCLIAAPANGYIGYLVTPQQYREGGYEATVCFVGPNGIDWVRHNLKGAVSGMR